MTDLLATRPLETLIPTRRDLYRLAAVAGALVLAMTAILAVDLSPRLDLQVGDLAPTDIKAPRALTFTNPVLTAAAQQEARDNVDPQYDFTSERAITISTTQLSALAQRVAPLDTAFDSQTGTEQRKTILNEALPDLSAEARSVLLTLDAKRWEAVRTEAARVLDVTERTELRDTEAADARLHVSEQMAGGLSDGERRLAGELISSLLIPNSSFSQDLTNQEKDRAAAAVPPTVEKFVQGQVIVRAGTQLDEVDLARIHALGLDVTSPDVAGVGGWLLLTGLLVLLLLGWIWRFRRAFWHRSNVLLLLALLVIFATFAVKLTAGRAAMPFALPIAGVGILVTVLLDAEIAVVVSAVVAIVTGAVNGPSLELGTYVLLGSLAGILAVRRGDKLAAFIQAGVAVFAAQAIVVTAFSLLGERDPTGVAQLIGAAGLSAGMAAVAAIGSFAVLGSVFGLLTVFQLLELANPSQPLLRRLLIETPGTYHHSLMVGNLAERAAEVIGADPLITRVAAYYHDIGKLANPAAFIENQAGGENVHDQLPPEESAEILKQHVADGIDLAYRSRLPKPLIAFIPQHHGTAIMSYFHARAREQAAEPFGGFETTEGRRAADAVDPRRYRHAGPKPQSREAALIMLADGVEASVRSLASRDEPAIRSMVARIIAERMDDGQFDECDLTLRDLDRIEDAFVAQLLGMYHQRVAYPQNKVVELESRRVAAGGERRGGPGGEAD
ncbi:MAG TPA: HDIG domain-containing protein [Candidatus Acidoferrales bacterium]|jgi:cyclic-di-AMP phosphodiesterase PgpH|nr:HDIG domain-containing protein [Candidatus Acidoferrales bacterium]